MSGGAPPAAAAPSEEAPAEDPGAAGEPRESLHTPTGRSWRAWLEPVAIVLIGAAWPLYVENSNLDSIARRSLATRSVGQKTWEHIELTVVSTLAVLVIAIPLGVLLSRTWARPATPFVLAVADIGQSAPAIGVELPLAVPVILAGIRTT
ncbi:hypothetical protein [Actinomadura physcomitrii]|uniref:hypothetical protein n=1 Tax=Actinomadura physcomitrii TaxID=2650748 RepID=UPI0019227666|nr:hypothetical protein [Actinomadura physcomitrii]